MILKEVGKFNEKKTQSTLNNNVTDELTAVLYVITNIPFSEKKVNTNANN